MTIDERREHFQARATSDGKKAQDLALATLEGAGFQIIKEGVKLSKLGIQFNFEVLDEEGRPFFVDVSGAFTTARPGLIRTDTLWKTLGRIGRFGRSGRRACSMQSRCSILQVVIDWPPTPKARLSSLDSGPTPISLRSMADEAPPGGVATLVVSGGSAPGRRCSTSGGATRCRRGWV